MSQIPIGLHGIFLEETLSNVRVQLALQTRPNQAASKSISMLMPCAYRTRITRDIEIHSNFPSADSSRD